MSNQEIETRQNAESRVEEHRDLKAKIQELEETLKLKTKEIEDLSRFREENPSPIIRLNKGGEVIYSNEIASEYFTNKIEDNIGVFKYWSREALALGRKIEKDIEINSIDFIVTIQPIIGEGYTNLYFVDVTEERKAKIKLENSELRYREIVEGAQDIIVKMDVDGDIIYVNKQAEEFFGYRNEDLVGSNYLDLLSDTSRVDFRKHLSTMVRDRKPAKMLRFAVQTKSNDTYWLSTNFQFGLEGALSSITMVSRDITEKFSAELKLQQSEEKYRSIIENMQLGLMEIDLDHKITRVYDHFCVQTGYSESELIGKKAVDVFLKNDEEKAKIEEQRLLRLSGEVTLYESVLYKKNGDKMWMLISGAPLFDDEGKVCGAIGIYLDITRQKNTENELILARERAEESMRSKELFVTNMSHEIRTPLNAIIGMTDILLRSNFSDIQFKMLNAVSVSSKNLLVIINDVLDISKVNQGQVVLEEIGFKLFDVINHIVDTNRLKTDAKDILLTTTFECDTAIVLKGDPFRLSQVILNLVGNAIKFTERGHVTIDVKTEKLTSTHAYLRFSVQDTGKGIAAEKLTKIFEQFNQEDATIARDYGGTGLGLSISKRLVELHDGKIDVESELGKGSEFSFWINYPLGTEADLPQIKEYEVDFERLAGLTVLLAEDNEFNQNLIENLFLEYRVNLTIANNGTEVLSHLAEKQFDIILMDVLMPVMDGVEATKEIRLVDEWKEIPILALTANAFSDELEKYLSYGMNGYISKPFDPLELYSKMLSLITKDTVNKLEQKSIFDSPIEQLYSVKKLSDMSKGKQVFVDKMVDSFLKFTPKLINEFENASQSEDWDLLSRLSHRLKPTLNTMSIDCLASDIHSLEKEYKSLDDDQKRILVDRVLKVVKRVIEHMKTL